MDILLFQDQEDIRSRVVFSLESGFNARVFEATNVAEALRILRVEKNLKLMIFDFLPGTPEMVLPLFNLNPKLPWILCNNPVLNEKNLLKQVPLIGTIERANMINGILDLIKNKIPKNPAEGETAGPDTISDREFCRIQTKLLLSVSPLKADIYIKLSDDHYVKLFRLGDVFDRKDLEKYTEKKGVHYLYLKQNETSEFINKYQIELESLLKSGKATVTDLTTHSVTLHETAQELIATMGFTRPVQQLAKTQVKMSIQAIKNCRSLTDLWKQLQKSKGKYIHTHSTFCSYISCAISSKLEWASDATYQKLSLASFLHDITLLNNDLAKIRNLEELHAAGVAKKFSEKELETYRNHPSQAAEMVKTMTQVPPDVDVIITQHHEWPDGTGFPRKMSHTHIQPLSCVFIVAHDLVDQMIEGKTTTKTYAALNQHRFTGGHFKKILKLLETL